MKTDAHTSLPHLPSLYKFKNKHSKWYGYEESITTNWFSNIFRLKSYSCRKICRA